MIQVAEALFWLLALVAPWGFVAWLTVRHDDVSFQLWRARQNAERYHGDAVDLRRQLDAERRTGLLASQASGSAAADLGGKHRGGNVVPLHGSDRGMEP